MVINTAVLVKRPRGPCNGRIQKLRPHRCGPLMFDRNEKHSVEKGQSFQLMLLEKPVIQMSPSARVDLK